jgi:hypothetical protein
MRELAALVWRVQRLWERLVEATFYIDSSNVHTVAGGSRRKKGKKNLYEYS